LIVTSGPTHYYIWYAVEGDPAAAMGTIDALIRAVEERTGIAGRVLARRDDSTTWMEIYENVGDAATFERTLGALADAHGALRIAAGGQRHMERFAALPDAAPGRAAR
jgi:Domain of unknown function (DUF4936)